METTSNQPLSTQGDEQQKEEQLGGSTNLSLDQLKQEGGIENAPDDQNPDAIENPDDLHEIQAGDDLDEPGEDEFNYDSNEDAVEQQKQDEQAQQDNQQIDSLDNGI